MRKRIISFIVTFVLLFGFMGEINTSVVVNAKGATYTEMNDVYYTKDNCVVYAEPTYTSTVLTTLTANVPVKVIGAYSNGWYRINTGVICYVKMDSVTTAGVVGIVAGDSQIADAKKTADELGYEFVCLTLNKEKKIKKDIFNSYIGKKVILYAKVDDELGVSFKMLYDENVKSDIDLNYSKTVSFGALGERIVEFKLSEPTQLYGQIAIFQFKEGYDKAVTAFPVDLDDDMYVEMNTYYTEFSEFAYAPVTQVANIKIVEEEIANSLSDTQREINSDHRKGIKYLSDDESDYRSSIHSKMRKYTEYVDYSY